MKQNSLTFQRLKKLAGEIKKIWSDENEWCFAFPDKLVRKAGLDKIRIEGKKVVWIGIGGSSSGPRGILQAFSKRQVIFFESPENSPRLEGNETLWIVSKSGTTYETIKVVEKTRGKPKEAFLLTADESSPLANLCMKKWKNVQILKFPKKLSGRYSTLFIGYPVFRWNKLKMPNFEKLRENFPSKTTLRIAKVFSETQAHLFVLIYSSKIFHLAENFGQLISESLGKKNKSFEPFTPTVLKGPEFQHSYAQLMLAHPDGKTVIFIIGKGNGVFDMGKKVASLFSKLMPTETFEVDEKPEDVMKFLFEFQLAVALFGIAVGVNPFDQPEVTKVRALFER